MSDATENPDDYLQRFEARKRKRRKIAALGAAVALGAAFVGWGPGWMIERASKSYSACSEGDYEDQPDPTTDCAGSKAWLLFPKIVPWKRAAALRESRSIERAALERKLKLSTSFAPDPTARDQAVAAIVRAFDEGAYGSEQLASILGVKGVGWAIGERRSKLDTGFGQSAYLTQAIAHGDIDEAIAFAKNPPALATEDYNARELFLRRGALACIDGDEKLGRATLHDAMHVNAQHHDFPFHEARIALAACGEFTVPKGDDLDRDALWSFQLGDRLTGKDLEDRLIGSLDFTKTVRDGQESPFVAAAIAERERPLEETLMIVAALSSFPKNGLTPWIWENALETVPSLVDPIPHEKAAERLEALAKTAPAIQKSLDERASARLPAFTEQLYLKIREKPAATLVQAARGFWLEAAGALSRMHQCDRAEADVRRAHALRESGTERLSMASLLVTCGRFEAAGEIAKDASDTTPLGATLLLDVRAQAVAHAGQFDQARELAKEAYTQLSKLPITTDPLTEFSDTSFIRSGTAYLYLALSLKTKNLSDAPSIDTPTIFEREKTTWSALVAKPETERAAARWRMFDFTGPLYSVARPAELFVAGSIVDGAGIEVWLDRTAFAYTKMGGRNMRARAEAARWRGDAKAESDWLARAGNIEKRLGDPRKAILARFAGL